jgi:hypothetical protein
MSTGVGGWRLGIAGAALVAVTAATGLVGAQEQSAQARLSGAWHLNPALSTRLPDPGGRAGASDKDSKWAGGGGAGEPVMAGARDLLQLMDDLTVAPSHVAITATVDEVTLIDDQGVARKFPATGKFEKIDFRVGKPSFKTRWDHNTLTQDITGDAIEMTRTFDVTPDGRQLTIAYSIRRQPDPKAMVSQGNRPEIRRYVYDRVQ